jgi:drug/metabolite transporter (DMT)-like permease
VAISHASASSLGPYTLLRLVIAVIGGIVLFREIPDLLSWLGVVAILTSCLLTMEPEPRGAKARALKAAP